MKLLGLIGGMSWESTSLYYSLLNEMVNQKLGGFHSCSCVIYSVDFENIVQWQKAGEKDKVLKEIQKGVNKLEKAGAEIILICTNSIHMYYDQIQEKTRIPVLHIANAAGTEIKRLKLKRPAILGTRYTMEQDFYTKYLIEHFDLDPMVPSLNDRNFIHELIFDQLVKGIISETARIKMLEIIQNLSDQGADCAVLGCTEIPLLIQQKHLKLPIIDTTKIHAKAAVELIL